MAGSRLAVVLVTAAVLLAGAALPGVADAQSGDSSQSVSSCNHLKKKARKARRGSARRRRYVRAYERCRRRAAQAPTDSSSTSGGPAPEPEPAPAPAPAPEAPAPLPNPDGYMPGQVCLRSMEARFNAAGFTCQFSGQYQSVYLYPTGWFNNPIYILFRLCPDGSGRIC